jgi:WD40 repeat protein
MRKLLLLLIGLAAGVGYATSQPPPNIEFSVLQGDSFISIAWSPDGAMLATISGNGVQLWNVSEQGISRRSTLSGITGSMRGLAFSPDGATLAAGSTQPVGQSNRVRGVVYRWEVQNARFLAPLIAEGSDNVGSPKHVVFSPDGSLLAFSYALHNRNCGRWAERVMLFDLQTGERFDMSPRLNIQVFDLAFSPDSALLAVNLGTSVCSINYGAIEIWDTVHHDKRATLRVDAFGTRTSDVLFSPDGAYLLVNASPIPIRRKSYVFSWNTSDFQPNPALYFQEGLIAQLAFSPNGAALAIADDHGRLHFSDPKRSLWVNFLTAGDETLRDIAFSPDGRRLATIDAMGSARIWHIR